MYSMFFQRTYKTSSTENESTYKRRTTKQIKSLFVVHLFALLIGEKLDLLDAKSCPGRNKIFVEIVLPGVAFQQRHLKPRLNLVSQFFETSPARCHSLLAICEAGRT